jgi:hypothetical protein
VTTASLPTLNPTVSIAVDPMAPRIMQDPVTGTATPDTLGPTTGITAEADLHGMQDPVTATAKPNTLDPVVSIVAEAVLRNMLDPTDATANLRTLSEVDSIVAEAGLRNMRDLIAKGVASRAQNADRLRE